MNIEIFPGASAVVKVLAKGVQKAVMKKAGEWRDWETEADADANLEKLSDMIDTCCDDQAKEVNDILAKWMASVKTYRFNKRQEKKLAFMRSQLDEKLILWDMASEEDGKVVCLEGPGGNLCRKVQKQLNLADQKQKAVENYGRMGLYVNRDARKDMGKGDDKPVSQLTHSAGELMLEAPDVSDANSLSTPGVPAEAVGEGYHPNVVCDRSGMQPIVGTRYHLKGEDYDLCEAEFNKLSGKEKGTFEAIPPKHFRQKVAAASVPAPAAVQEVEGQDATEALRHVGAFVVVSAPSWCPHCPPAEERFKKHAQRSNAAHYVIHEEAPANKSILRQLGVKGYPTFLQVVAPGQHKQVQI